MMATEFLLTKFFAVAVTVFHFVILIDGVKQDNLALMEIAVGKTFSYDGTSRKYRREGCSGGGALHLGYWWCGHPLNSGRVYPLSMKGGGT